MRRPQFFLKTLLRLMVVVACFFAGALRDEPAIELHPDVVFLSGGRSVRPIDAIGGRTGRWLESADLRPLQ